LNRKLNIIKLDNYKPLRDVVFDVMREAIVSGKLKPGERLMELQLAEEMGVSRTPVREAIRKSKEAHLRILKKSAMYKSIRTRFIQWKTSPTRII